MFNEINWLAVIVYCASFALVTEITKRRVTVNPLYLSWGIGAAMFAVVHGVWALPITLESVGIFCAATLVTNGSYKSNKILWRFLASKFSWLPGPDQAEEKK